MAILDLLIDDCDIMRYTSTQDAYGQLIKSWLAHSTGNKCRVTSPVNREVQSGVEIVIADKLLFVGEYVDVTEKDRVVINGATYEILSVSVHRGMEKTHQELLLRTIK